MRDFRNQMTDEEFTQSGLRGLAEDKIVAKLQWSRQACNIMHGQWSFHGTPYQIPESQQKVVSPNWESNDSEATIAYGGETEEDTSTSSLKLFRQHIAAMPIYGKIFKIFTTSTRLETL